jgi:dihydrofolate reductase
VNVAKLSYTAITSLDGYIADERGNFDWSAPNEEVHAFVNDLERDVGTHLYGRRLYETMVVWEDLDTSDEPTVIRDYADIWRASDKVVYSTTLDDVTSARTRLERHLDVSEVDALKRAATRDLTVGGANLAGQLMRAGLVDEVRLLLTPVVVGGGTHWAPKDVFLRCALLDHRRFADGTVFTRYALAS